MKKIKRLVIALIIVAASAFLLTNENVFKADVTEDGFICLVKESVYMRLIDCK